MKKRITKLVAGCVMVSAALLLIQFYFLRNTYFLYQQQALNEIKGELNVMEKKINLDSMRFDWMYKIEKLISAHSKEYLQDYAQKTLDSILCRRVSQFISSNNLLKSHQVKYNAKINQASIRFENSPYQPILIKENFWFGNDSNHINQYNLNQYTLTRTLKSGTNEPVFCELKTDSGFTVKSWFSPLMTKLTGLMLFSVLLIFGVIAVFYMSIKNIIKQKRISDLQSDFVNNIQHEFNTPLAALDVAIATLKTQENNFNAVKSNALSTIERQSKRLNLLIKRAIEFSKREQDIQLNKVSADVSQLLTNIITDIGQSNPNAEINFKPLPDTNNLHIDPFYITTAINNILDNGIKYGGNKIEVCSDIVDGYFKISVKDYGTGISAIKRNMIFEKFYRIETGDTHNIKGLGLGLFYAKQIMHAHHGEIEVESEVGKGSVFTILIPLK